ncbi:tRNA (adenosine(37)-N6)-threonylcarbamoyltransferase complex ATPase subunit type 1 TsaE [Alteromonas sediminis]|uniref:tRNA threonylcarbamoyladenosine biosynthesis protein TsaE n=1 Tax=Alteromonas sediminis TaxID=2259342 RepID=A0A3N5Y4Z5_9ALTE|nr:tRNA (adenosine(37)-N6)-threonylcarbamoyltransferase complex ATPase subunit type 1 TsaE [Alteromonas sediminis]RPJ65259.1 tRNA (adenosine(37)-N6)-threonylcarbamoyltransferase complex ATPase subunit type 1 TsaE [Alteromonas sediminis]
MSTSVTFSIDDLEQTAHVGACLAKAIAPHWESGVILYLSGDLGAGKTTLSRYILRTLGHQGNVKSPTYTLVEPYELEAGNVYHFDLYRLADPEELEFMGVRDYFGEKCICLIEWAEKGANYLASADLAITLELGEKRSCTIGATSKRGETIVEVCRRNKELA